MGEPRCVEADWAFGRGGHTVRLRLARAALAVEVQSHLTAEQWRADFDAAFIEDLTRRTGNFKQFGVFCSMLESALTRSSESVSLELLTYADLEALRSRKAGAAARPAPPAPSPLGAKRYLILVYSVEFDRIHYPLPLPFAGRPERELRGDRRDAEIRRLQDELQRALEEKRAAEAALRALRREPAGGGAARRAARRLEDELQRERARHRHEQRRLAAELAEVKASERRLQLRVKSLTAELASCKRGRTTPTGTAPRPRERRSPAATRSASRESRGSAQGRPPARSPAPAGPRPPRFDPTAFVRARQRRRQEAELKSQQRGAAFGSTSPMRRRGRSSSADSARSCRVARSSSSEAEERSEPLPPRGRRVTRTRRPLSTSSCNSPGLVTNCKPPAGSGASACHGKENCYEEPSLELAEIDARLQALQEYMESLDTRT